LKLIHQQQSNRKHLRSIYLLCVFRDENLLLEYFVEYYRSLGVTHFIMIDNLSEDEGPEYLKSLKNINLHLFCTEESYRDAKYGTRWINQILEKYCIDHYCFTVDVDELFLFDSRKYQTLHDLIDDMESSGTNVVPVTLLDMYPERTNDSYQKGTEFLRHSPFFDDLSDAYYEERGAIYGSFVHKVGGVRKRVLGATVCIHKFPFFKYEFYPLGVAPGYHFFQSDGKVLLQSENIKLHGKLSVLLHFKFIKPQFMEFIEKRVSNNQDWENSAEYRSYLQVLQSKKTLDFYDERYTKRLIKHEDLEKFFTCCL